jgi:2-polyprenyl-3-methyl-5-hydroxy-6-metoxy-1,4-benzoquinol methylase
MRNPLNSQIPGHIQANFRTVDKKSTDLIEVSLRKNYFAGCPEMYLSTDCGRNDLKDHLWRRLEIDRKMIIPWLDDARPLRKTSILEIGCGSGSSTVALAEQGANVTAIDINENSLVVAADRCRAYDLDVTFAHANATEVEKLFSGRHFDSIIFYASLEHMTIKERLSAMRASWEMLSAGGFCCVIETPNRLWYYDAHTSLLPFHMWLPDELAFEYSRFSPRYNYRELYREYSEESKLHFLRRGRGVSFHEFEIVMKPLTDLRIKSYIEWLKWPSEKKGLLELVKERFSNEYRYFSVLRRIAPKLHEAFLQSFLYLIVEKD